jgi:hypothetical protein
MPSSCSQRPCLGIRSKSSVVAGAGRSLNSSNRGSCCPNHHEALGYAMRTRSNKRQETSMASSSRLSETSSSRLRSSLKPDEAPVTINDRNFARDAQEYDLNGNGTQPPPEMDYDESKAKRKRLKIAGLEPSPELVAISMGEGAGIGLRTWWHTLCLCFQRDNCGFRGCASVGVLCHQTPTSLLLCSAGGCSVFCAGDSWTCQTSRVLLLQG